MGGQCTYRIENYSDLYALTADVRKADAQNRTLITMQLFTYLMHQ